jgi:hypothetical protein
LHQAEGFQWHWKIGHLEFFKTIAKITYVLCKPPSPILMLLCMLGELLQHKSTNKMSILVYTNIEQGEGDYVSYNLSLPVFYIF